MKRGKNYNPEQVIKSSGVHTFFIGEVDSPLFQAFEAYLWLNEKTFSEGTRNILAKYFQDIEILDAQMQKTELFDSYREKAELMHDKQLIVHKEKRMAEAKLKEEKLREKSSRSVAEPAHRKSEVEETAQ